MSKWLSRFVLAAILPLSSCAGESAQSDVAEVSEIGGDSIAELRPELEVAADPGREAEADLPECIPQCEGKQCGEDGCGSLCGICPATWTCELNQCQCHPDCEGKECGPDHCAGWCGSCPSLEVCGPDGQCRDKAESTLLFADTVLKINFIDICEGALPGCALDLDQDPETCAPEGSCQDGLDHQLGGLLGQINAFVDVPDELASALESGELVLLASMVDFDPAGGAFTMSMFKGKPALPKEECDWQSEYCEYLVDPSDVDLATGQAKMVFNNAMVVDGKLTAGGPGYGLMLPLSSVSGTLDGSLPAVMTRVEGTAVMSGAKLVGLKNAVLGGAIRKSALLELCDMLSDDLPVSPGTCGSRLSMALVSDMDTDYDGEADAESFGMMHEAIAGHIGGFADCEPTCDGKECGPDGCGWICGSCPTPSDLCVDGLCQPCVPQCEGKECGPDGCGWVCGLCTKGPVPICSSVWKCLACAPSCSGKECGPDGCGGSCGECTAELACIAGQCVDPACPWGPQCGGVECGPDGCGGSCGECGEGLLCSFGACVCQDGPVGIPTSEEGQVALQGTVLHLLDHLSYLPEGYGEVTGWSWSVVAPTGSKSDFVPSASAPNPTFLLDVAGTYAFSLELTSEAGPQPCPGPGHIVQAFEAKGLWIELRWQTPGDPEEGDTGPEAGADLDLHFLHPFAGGPDLDGDLQPDGWFDMPFDCFWFNPEPNWGSFDPNLDDDPHVVVDDVDGKGPEVVQRGGVPEAGVYRIGVHAWNDHGYGGSYARISVFIDGVEVYETPDVMLQPLDMWDALAIEFPSGYIAAITDGSGHPKITPNYQHPAFTFE